MLQRLKEKDSYIGILQEELRSTRDQNATLLQLVVTMQRQNAELLRSQQGVWNQGGWMPLTLPDAVVGPGTVPAAFLNFTASDVSAEELGLPPSRSSVRETTEARERSPSKKGKKKKAGNRQ
jgi:hypothetical protein